jgi:hypothetical protein
LLDYTDKEGIAVEGVFTRRMEPASGNSSQPVNLKTAVNAKTPRGKGPVK